ncbi:hypothetical protein BDR22DRAFT_830646 [Usnea florida]
MGWREGEGLGAQNNGTVIPVEQAAGKLVLGDDDPDIEKPRGFVASSVRTKGNPGYYERPVVYVRKCAYPFAIDNEKAREWDKMWWKHPGRKGKLIEVDDPYHALPGISMAYSGSCCSFSWPSRPVRTTYGIRAQVHVSLRYRQRECEGVGWVVVETPWEERQT